jgi:nitrite reductase (NADH) small subunit
MTAVSDSGLAHRLGPIDQIPVGEGRAFGVEGVQIAVFRLRSGAVHAVSAVCPHRGGPIADGQIDGSIVLCPLHMNAFELSTGCSTTGQEPLASWRVELDEAGQIVLYTPSPAFHPPFPRSELRSFTHESRR